MGGGYVAWTVVVVSVVWILPSREGEEYWNRMCLLTPIDRYGTPNNRHTIYIYIHLPVLMFDTSCVSPPVLVLALPPIVCVTHIHTHTYRLSFFLFPKVRQLPHKRI